MKTGIKPAGQQRTPAERQKEEDANTTGLTGHGLRHTMRTAEE